MAEDQAGGAFQNPALREESPPAGDTVLEPASDQQDNEPTADEEPTANEEPRMTLQEANEEMRRIKEDPDLSNAERSEKMNAAFERLSRQVRPDALNSFQRYQKERTKEELEKQNEGANTTRVSPEYTPPNTVRGTEGDNANYDPEGARDPNEEWDPHGGESEEDLPDNYEPAERPE